jgi:hypothetical protein
MLQMVTTKKQMIILQKKQMKRKHHLVRPGKSEGEKSLQKKPLVVV